MPTQSLRWQTRWPFLCVPGTRWLASLWSLGKYLFRKHLYEEEILTEHDEIDSKPIEKTVGAGDEGHRDVETTVGENRSQAEEKCTKNQTSPTTEERDEDQPSWNIYDWWGGTRWRGDTNPAGSWLPGKVHRWKISSPNLRGSGPGWTELLNRSTLS